MKSISTVSHYNNNTQYENQILKSHLNGNYEFQNENYYNKRTRRSVALDTKVLEVAYDALKKFQEANGITKTEDQISLEEWIDSAIISQCRRYLVAEEIHDIIYK